MLKAKLHHILLGSDVNVDNQDVAVSACWTSWTCTWWTWTTRVPLQVHYSVNVADLTVNAGYGSVSVHSQVMAICTAQSVILLAAGKL
jgi:hypothetical protein